MVCSACDGMVYCFMMAIPPLCVARNKCRTTGAEVLVEATCRLWEVYRVAVLHVAVWRTVTLQQHCAVGDVYSANETCAVQMRRVQYTQTSRSSQCADSAYFHPTSIAMRCTRSQRSCHSRNSYLLGQLVHPGPAERSPSNRPVKFSKRPPPLPVFMCFMFQNSQHNTIES